METDPSKLETFEQISAATASNLVKAAAHQAFQLFQEKDFRRLANFDVLAQVEQDRIFNELVVSFIVLLMLMLEAPDLRVPPELRDYLQGIRERIPEAHINYLSSLGIEPHHLRDWQKLLDLRYEEYVKDKHEVRAAAMELESSEKPLELNDLSKIQLLVPVQTVAIGGHDHICRGATRGRDELFKLTLRALARFYLEMRLRLEGGKTPPLTKAKLAWKKFRQGKR